MKRVHDFGKPLSRLAVIFSGLLSFLSYKTTFFERKDGIEIETFDGKTDTSTVRWVSDCEYILQKKHPKNRAEEKAISMKILTTSKDSYTFEFGMVGSEEKQRGTVTKID